MLKKTLFYHTFFLNSYVQVHIRTIGFVHSSIFKLNLLPVENKKKPYIII